MVFDFDPKKIGPKTNQLPETHSFNTDLFPSSGNVSNGGNDFISDILESIGKGGGGYRRYGNRGRSFQMSRLHFGNSIAAKIHAQATQVGSLGLMGASFLYAGDGSNKKGEPKKSSIAPPFATPYSPTSGPQILFG